MRLANCKDSYIRAYLPLHKDEIRIVGLLICECVRSNRSFHPHDQDVDFDILEMFFSFQCAKHEENRWLNTNFSKKKTIRLFCTIVTTVYCCVMQRLVTSDGSDGTQNDPGHPDNEWG